MNSFQHQFQQPATAGRLPPLAFSGADVHCHCLPGLDDGPRTPAEALALCRALAADGVHTVVATPHQLGGYHGRNAPQQVRDAVAALNEQVQTAGVPLRVLPGADVRLDERLPDLLEQGEVLTVADLGRHILLEIPHQTYVEPLALIRTLVEREVRPIITHPERHGFVQKNPPLLRVWIGAGACLQITAGSLLGDFGESARRAAWRFIGEADSVLIANDAHDCLKRPPRLSAAFDAIRSRFGQRLARRLCIDHPADVLAGRDLEPIFANSRTPETLA